MSADAEFCTLCGKPLRHIAHGHQGDIALHVKCFVELKRVGAFKVIDHVHEWARLRWEKAEDEVERYRRKYGALEP